MKFSSKLLKDEDRRNIVIIVSLLIIVDFLLIYFNVDSAIENRIVEIKNTPSDILDVQRINKDNILIRTESSVFQAGTSGLVEYNVSGIPLDCVAGSTTGAVAIANDKGEVYYYKPGEFEPLFHVNLRGDVDLLGISEKYVMQVYSPSQIACLVRNESGTYLLQLSISSGGGVLWNYKFDEDVVTISISELGRGIAVGLNNSTVYLFKSTDNRIRAIFHFSEKIHELVISSTDLHLGVLYGNVKKYLASVDLYKEKIIWTTEVPTDSKDLQIHADGEWYALKSGNTILAINDTVIRPLLQSSPFKDFALPSIADEIFISKEEKIEKYRPGRNNPIWRADITGMKNLSLLTDAAGSMLVSWAGNQYVIINDSTGIYGNSMLWRVIGFLLIGEAIAIPLFVWRRKIAKLNRHAIFVILMGAFGGAVAGTIISDPDPIAFFGGENSYLVIAASIAAFSSFISWNAEGGIGSIVYGVAIGLMMSIPIAITASFVLWVFGVEFSSGEIFFSAALNGFIMGFKMALVGAIIGFAYHYFTK
ncbi:MAG: hypothetical protein H5T41_01595 [Methanomassiliicoccales archaeon]|nr:hypothetical protein [Methanomassiliicoccales archaeon]